MTPIEGSETPLRISLRTEVSSVNFETSGYLDCSYFIWQLMHTYACNNGDDKHKQHGAQKTRGVLCVGSLHTSGVQPIPKLIDWYLVIHSFIHVENV